MSYKVLTKQETNPSFYKHYHNFIPKGAVSMIAGQGSSGKSTFLCWLADYLSDEGTVALVSNEESADIISSRLKSDSNVNIISFSSNQNSEKITIKDLFEIIDKFDIILIDSLISFNERKDLNRAGTAEAFLSPFVAKVTGTNKAIVFLHHTTKNFGNTLQDMISGSERLVSGIRHCRVLINDKDNNRRFIALAKDNTGLKELNYEIIAKEINPETGTPFFVIEKLILSNEDMDKIIYMNSRAAKFKQWDKELSLRKSKNPPISIVRVLKHFQGKDITLKDVKELGQNEYVYFCSAANKNNNDWVIKTKKGLEVNYIWTEKSLQWLKENS